MFRPAKIHHTRVILKEDKVDKLINKLSEQGLCQLKESSLDISSKYSYDIVKNLDDVQTRFDFLINSLEEYKEILQPENRLKNVFSPPPPEKHKSFLYSTEEIVKEVSHHLELIEPKILEKLNSLQNIKEQIQKNNFLISNLSSMPDIETNIFQSSDNIKVFIGLTTTTSLPKITLLRDKAVIASEKIDKTRSLITIFTSLEESTNIEKVLHAVGFENLDLPYEDKKPEAIIESLKLDINQLESKKTKIAAFFKKTYKVYDKKFILLSEELTIAKEKILALQNFKTTETFSVLEAWVPVKNFDKFHNTLKEVSPQYYIEIEEEQNAPTLLNNAKLVEPFEMITNLYSPPKYGEFDPTIIIAITFTLFFGFMLTDAAYGLILILLGMVLYRGIGKYDQGSKKFATLLLFFGISTMLLGMLFGSYFGDFFQKIGVNLPVPIDPMRQATTVLTIALGLGAIHLLVGLFIGFYENIRKKNIKDAFSQQGIWLFFMFGLILFLLKLVPFAMILITIAVILQLVFNFMEGGAVVAILSIFSFTGFIGDLFSYARLMALALGTAGIALAVNFMIFLTVDSVPYIGIIFGVIIFIMGHIFNLLMNGLGAFVHSTRLHFLELFTKFYDGGGKAYKPFKAERKSTYIQGG